MVNPKDVFLAIPTTGWLHRGTVRHILTLRKAYPDLYISFKDGHQGSHVVRNAIVADFLKADKEWLLMIDDDVVPTTDPLKLATSGHDICGGLCLSTYKPLDVPGPCIYYYNSEDEAFTIVNPEVFGGICEVDAVGAGCIMIHRRVLEHAEMKIPFDLWLNADGTVKVGSDLYFCIKAKACGFSVAVNLDVPCDHICRASLLHIKQSYEQSTINILKEQRALWEQERNEKIG